MNRHALTLALAGLTLFGLPGCRTAPVAHPTPTAISLDAPTAAPLAEPVEQQTLTTAAGRSIRIFDSPEGDSYDDPTVPLSLDASSDTFAGTDRKATKLSLLNEPYETLPTVQELWSTLEWDDDMMQREPPISRSSKSRRVAEEKRNVEVDGLLCAASREDDNDFHLIVCDNPDLSPDERYCLNVEVSGLPEGGAYLQRLTAARQQFVELVGGNPPGSKYRFYDPCIPVSIRGPLFYDISHPPGAVGPSKLRPDTAWEIHLVETIQERP